MPDRYIVNGVVNAVAPAAHPAAAQPAAAHPAAALSWGLLLAPALSLAIGSAAVARTLVVGGPVPEFSRVASAAAVALDGDTIIVHAGTYPDDFATFTQNRLTLRSVNGRAHLRALQAPPNGKAIWVIGGDAVVVDGFEFSGARVPDRNGAGIRAEGGALTIRDSYFHHNQMAVLAGTPRTEITITGSEFAHQMRDGRFTHSVYVAGRSLHMEHNTLRDVAGGHHIKSRAAVTVVRHNAIDDGGRGTASYLIDLPDCGDASIVSNTLRKGRRASNGTAIAYGAEACAHGPGRVVISGNDYVDALGTGPFVANFSYRPVLIENNVVRGTRRLVKGPAHLAGNQLLAGGQ